MKFSTSLLFASVLSAGLLVGCDGGSGTSQPAQKTAAEAPKAAPVVIYTNADEEAQQAMKNALDKNGLQGAYLMQSFGTSELGGKLVAEGKNIEADVVTISTYYLESMQKSQKLFRDLGRRADINFNAIEGCCLSAMQGHDSVIYCDPELAATIRYRVGALTRFGRVPEVV